jgi:hypothetical protein
MLPLRISDQIMFVNSLASPAHSSCFMPNSMMTAITVEVPEVHVCQSILPQVNVLIPSYVCRHAQSRLMMHTLTRLGDTHRFSTLHLCSKCQRLKTASCSRKGVTVACLATKMKPTIQWCVHVQQLPLPMSFLTTVPSRLRT